MLGLKLSFVNKSSQIRYWLYQTTLMSFFNFNTPFFSRSTITQHNTNVNKSSILSYTLKHVNVWTSIPGIFDILNTNSSYISVIKCNSFSGLLSNDNPDPRISIKLWLILMPSAENILLTWSKLGTCKNMRERHIFNMKWNCCHSIWRKQGRFQDLKLGVAQTDWNIWKAGGGGGGGGGGDAGKHYCLNIFKIHNYHSIYIFQIRYISNALFITILYLKPPYTIL